jgi:hypothetical protein
MWSVSRLCTKNSSLTWSECWVAPTSTRVSGRTNQPSDDVHPASECWRRPLFIFICFVKRFLIILYRFGLCSFIYKTGQKYIFLNKNKILTTHDCRQIKVGASQHAKQR